MRPPSRPPPAPLASPAHVLLGARWAGGWVLASLASQDGWRQVGPCACSGGQVGGWVLATWTPPASPASPDGRQGARGPAACRLPSRQNPSKRRTVQVHVCAPMRALRLHLEVGCEHRVGGAWAPLNTTHHLGRIRQLRHPPAGVRGRGHRLRRLPASTDG